MQFLPLQMLSLLLLLLLLLFHPQHVVSLNPLFASCSTSGNYTSRDPFRNNLSRLVSALIKEAPSIGFGLSSFGLGDERVHGLALCQGDFKISACKSCIRTATSQIHKHCPFKKEAFISFGQCLFRYSNIEFFGEIDNEHKFHECSNHNASMPMPKLGSNAMKLMNMLKRKTYLSPLLFSTGVVKIGMKEKMYGLAQCSRDLSGGDCKKCLEAAIGGVLNWCEGKRGGRVVTGSCNVRYELEPFFDEEEDVLLHTQY